jgi:hypothetical protein
MACPNFFPQLKITVSGCNFQQCLIIIIYPSLHLNPHLLILSINAPFPFHISSIRAEADHPIILPSSSSEKLTFFSPLAYLFFWLE